ncbi:MULTISPECIES: hypothetical protein [Myroides]|uniref:Lipoprotein n=1 Tax=Myroides profundi TaxID=480520 RepID=A0AAJ5BFA1_MYRPR|nr:MULTISPECIES: hypothetical protein [Myroides]AJH15566.1 hypothetical protein MPR_2395 [Myroides profundi]MCA4806484.1 hypothetical protein [Myroides odoratimimus]SER52148.1 hypothetical protein SAMN04488089_1183 [Myroides profundi]
MKDSIRKTSKIIALALFLAVGAVSCSSSSDDPTGNDMFAGQYLGKVSFVEGDKKINNDKGSLEVLKKSNEEVYVTFSDKIPSIRGVKFESKENGTIQNVGATESNYIRINAKTVSIKFEQEGKTWNAEGKRN